jgi:cob(I)alamin adenosyltransferase
MSKKKGLVMVYTGNGKGKTTAALGLAVRAVGHDEKVIIIQFMKGNRNYGEIKALEKYLPIEIIQSGRDEFVNKNNPEQVDVDLAHKAVEMARSVLKEKQVDLLILDEINVALDFNLISKEDVLELIDLKPETTDLVLTGRYAHPDVIERADLVSEVKEVKHHYQKGVPAQTGIEF